MPPARPRVDDSRSDASSVIAGQKDRGNLGLGISKAKKNSIIANSDMAPTSKNANINGNSTLTQSSTLGADEDEIPQTDWSSIAIPILHTYRAAYKIATPASYTRPHAELIYNSSDVARRSPSQVLARKKLKELRLHRRKVASTNGISRKVSKRKDKEDANENSTRDGRRKNQNGTYLHPLSNGDSIAQSIEPTSPTIGSASAVSDSTTSTLLNISNPEATIIGRQSPSALATGIRKHFNAQQLQEQETIARFTYVLRQQGYGSAPMPLPLNNSSSTSNATSNRTLQKTSTPIRVEGSDGDGTGWIMGSMGRQVRMNDSGGSGAFRLRFRPQL